MSEEHARRPGRPFPPMTVGVMGSAGGDLPEELRARLRDLGTEIARRGYVLVTGACPGLPHEAVKGADAEGGVVVGISPALDFTEHVKRYRSPSRGYDAMVYTGSGLMGREIENIRSCDAVIFAGGRSGTLGEFAIAFDEGKIIGVLTGTGGISDEIHRIVEMIHKETGSILCYESEPVLLLNALERIYEREVIPRYRAALEGHDPDGSPEGEGPFPA